MSKKPLNVHLLSQAAGTKSLEISNEDRLNYAIEADRLALTYPVGTPNRKHLRAIAKALRFRVQKNPQ